MKHVRIQLSQMLELLGRSDTECLSAFVALLVLFFVRDAKGVIINAAQVNNPVFLCVVFVRL